MFGVIRVNQKEIRKILATRLREFRTAAGLTAKEVGEKVGKSEKTVSAWEHGRGQPDADMLFTLCNLYGIRSFDKFYSLGPVVMNEKITADLPVDLPDYFDSQIVTSDGLLPDEQELLTLYRGADDRAREDAIDTLRKHQKQDTAVKAI